MVKIFKQYENMHQRALLRIQVGQFIDLISSKTIFSIESYDAGKKKLDPKKIKVLSLSQDLMRGGDFYVLIEGEELPWIHKGLYVPVIKMVVE